MRRNGMMEGFLYLQVTRGVAERDFFFPRECRADRDDVHSGQGDREFTGWRRPVSLS